MNSPTRQLSTLTMAAMLCLGGCANLNSVHRELQVTKGEGALIDIKQRAILAAPSTVSPSGAFVCAEPSPDALSVYAAEIAAKADIPNKLSAQFSGSAQESGAFTGLRTQSIQLLRDSMYRTCEAYLNGAISPQQYDLLARRYQKHTVALLAIEQLTGAVKVPPITLSTRSTAETARSLSETRAELDAVDKQIADVQAKLNDPATPAADKTALTQKLTGLKADRDRIAQGLDNVGKTLASGETKVKVSTDGNAAGTRDLQVISSVTDAVKSIVKDIINADDTGQLCFMQLSKNAARLPDKDNKEQQLSTYCAKLFELEAKRDEISTDALRMALDALKSSNAKGTDKADASLKIAEMAEKISANAKSRQLKLVPATE